MLSYDQASFPQIFDFLQRGPDQSGLSGIGRKVVVALLPWIKLDQTEDLNLRSLNHS